MSGIIENNPYEVVSHLMLGLNALSLNHKIYTQLNDSVSIGAITDAEMIASSAYYAKEINQDNYNALMFIFRSVGDFDEFA